MIDVHQRKSSTPTDPCGTDPHRIDHAMIDLLVEEHQRWTLPRLHRLWAYYRNPVQPGGGPDCLNKRHLAQAQGLPRRLRQERGVTTGSNAREIVIENDIGWRIGVLVDFMFGKPVTIQSCAPSPTPGSIPTPGKARADLLELFLRRVFDRAGGIGFFQDMALLGAVYGQVDVLVNVQSLPGVTNNDDPERAAECFVLELIEAPRAIPVLNPTDFRRLDAYVLEYEVALNQVDPPGFLSRLRDRLTGGESRNQRRSSLTRRCVWTDREYQALTYRGENGERKLIHEERSANRLGRIPVVHIQNLPQPFYYEGLSEVEPLVPLQDELNTRLSDRANRVTFQSFKMYLGKGIEKFNEQPIGPGQMWSTDNPAASIEEFGGDAASPSEDAHIAEIREAMDKASGVSPLAAGVVRDRVGNLTSENALRVVMMGLLAKTERKRQTYGVGIERLCELVLHAADVYGMLPNDPSERHVRLDWPSAIPENQTQRLQDARLKLELGVPRKQVLTELGYGDCSD